MEGVSKLPRGWGWVVRRQANRKTVTWYPCCTSVQVTNGCLMTNLVAFSCLPASTAINPTHTLLVQKARWLFITERAWSRQYSGKHSLKKVSVLLLRLLIQDYSFTLNKHFLIHWSILFFQLEMDELHKSRCTVLTFELRLVQKPYFTWAEWNSMN